MRYLKLWCEWDYGQENILFTSEEQGRKWLEQEMREIGGPEEFLESFPGGIEQVFAEHLAGFEIMSVCED